MSAVFQNRIRAILQNLNRLTAKDPATVACETGRTGGRRLQAPAAFFCRFTRQRETISPTRPPEVNTMFPTQVWLVTWQRRNGDIQTNAVMISGAWPMADIEAQARDALNCQCDMADVQILRLSLDFNMTPARLEALQDITTKYQNRMHFEEGCG